MIALPPNQKKYSWKCVFVWVTWIPHRLVNCVRVSMDTGGITEPAWDWLDFSLPSLGWMVLWYGCQTNVTVTSDNSGIGLTCKKKKRASTLLIWLHGDGNTYFYGRHVAQIVFLLPRFCLRGGQEIKSKSECSVMVRNLCPALETGQPSETGTERKLDILVIWIWAEPGGGRIWELAESETSCSLQKSFAGLMMVQPLWRCLLACSSLCLYICR